MMEPEFPKVSWYLTAFVGVMIIVTALSPGAMQSVIPAVGFWGPYLDSLHSIVSFAGLAFPTAFLDRFGAWAFAVWGPILAITVEVIQANYGHDASARDVVLYLIGGSIGAASGVALRQWVIKRSHAESVKGRGAEDADEGGIHSAPIHAETIKPEGPPDEAAQPEPQQPNSSKTKRIK